LFVVLLIVAPISQKLEPPANPVRFSLDICAVRRPMRRYKDWPRREYQFGRLSGKPVIVENWFAMSCVVNASMYSERSRVRWITGCHGLTTVGKKGRETPWRCGAR